LLRVHVLADARGIRERARARELDRAVDGRLDLAVEGVELGLGRVALVEDAPAEGRDRVLLLQLLPLLVVAVSVGVALEVPADGIP
jgi:hypothetical protein